MIIVLKFTTEMVNLCENGDNHNRGHICYSFKIASLAEVIA